MDVLTWTDKPDLRDPVLVCAFKGWDDAGESATAAVGFLVDSFDATEVARVDPEEFFDFTAVRPNVRLTEGRSRAIDWPDTVITAARIPNAERDLVFLQGVEPSLKWRTFTGAIAGAARDLGTRGASGARLKMRTWETRSASAPPSPSCAPGRRSRASSPARARTG